MRELKEQEVSPGNSLGESWHRIPALGQRAAPLSQGHNGEGLREWKGIKPKQQQESLCKSQTELGILVPACSALSIHQLSRGKRHGLINENKTVPGHELLNFRAV